MKRSLGDEGPMSQRRLLGTFLVKRRTSNTAPMSICIVPSIGADIVEL